MGVWQSGRGFVSDGMADTIDDALKSVKEFVFPRKYKFVTMSDLADIIELVSNGIFVIEIHPDGKLYKDFPISEFWAGSIDTIPNRGQIKSANSNPLVINIRESNKGMITYKMQWPFIKAFQFIGERCWLLREDNFPTMTDLADALEFCSCGILVVEFHPDAEKYKNMLVSDVIGKVKNIPNRGQARKAKR